MKPTSATPAAPKLGTSGSTGERSPNGTPSASSVPHRMMFITTDTAEIVSDPTADQIVGCLSDHVWQPVLWQASIDAIRVTHPDAVFVEVGPRPILHDMLRQTGVGETPKFHTADPAAFAATVAMLRRKAA